LVFLFSDHEGPVSSLNFSSIPLSSLLGSVSWDKTSRIWDAVSSAASLTREAINLTSDGLAVCFRPDGQQVAVAFLDGHISICDPHQVSIPIMNLSGLYLYLHTIEENFRVFGQEKGILKFYI
jgi:periodic tryptophan protein 2